MPDPTVILDEVLGEADALIWRRLEELPHLVMAVPQEGGVVLRSNVDPAAMRFLGQDLIDISNEMSSPPKEGDTTH